MFDCGVAVIGYGPTGMVLAPLLGKCGHRVAVLERFPGLYNRLARRASTTRPCGSSRSSGIRDGHNLAWKLDLVLTGRAGADILDTYQAERAPHVRFITEKAIEPGRVQTLRDPAEARRRDERLLARRRAQQAPDKVSLPPLSGGLVANDGSFFPQGRVRFGGRDGLFDDVVGLMLSSAWLSASRLESSFTPALKRVESVDTSRGVGCRARLHPRRAPTFPIP